MNDSRFVKQYKYKGNNQLPLPSVPVVKYVPRKITQDEAAVGALLFCITSNMDVPQSLQDHLRAVKVNELSEFHAKIVSAFLQSSWSTTALECVFSAMLDQKLKSSREKNTDQDIYDKVGY